MNIIILTPFEKEIIRHISENFRYMVRDSSGHLYIYEMYPRKDYSRGCETWTHDCGIFECIPLKEVFEFIQWENSSPWQFR